jgi:hypothetical protein
MKFLIAAYFLLASFFSNSASFDMVNSQTAIQHNRNKNMSPQNGTKMKITIGAAVFKTIFLLLKIEKLESISGYYSAIFFKLI